MRRSPGRVLDSLLHSRIAAGLAPALPSPGVAPWVLAVFSVGLALHSLSLLGETQRDTGAAAPLVPMQTPQPTPAAQPPAASRGATASQVIVAFEVGMAIGVACACLAAWFAKRQGWLATTSRAAAAPDAEASRRPGTLSNRPTSSVGIGGTSGGRGTM